MYTLEEMRRAIEHHGVRLTPQRSAIVAELVHFSGIFSVADLQRRMEETHPDLGRATLFRTIDLFLRLGVLERMHREEGEDGYIVGMAGHHHHLVCRVCGEVRHIDFCPLEAVIDERVRREGYSEAVHRFDIEGICSACRSKRETAPGARGQGPRGLKVGSSLEAR
ncbi:MAG: Fur family transcriptional regulator [Leptospirales bacterium]